MTPYEQLQEFYRKNPPLSWERDLEEYGRAGYVHITPSFVLVGCGCGDGWFIRLAIGRGQFKIFAELMPYWKPYIGWARVARGRSEVVWYDTARVLRLAHENISVYPTEHEYCCRLRPPAPKGLRSF